MKRKFLFFLIAVGWCWAGMAAAVAGEKPLEERGLASYPPTSQMIADAAAQAEKAANAYKAALQEARKELTGDNDAAEAAKVDAAIAAPGTAPHKFTAKAAKAAYEAYYTTMSDTARALAGQLAPVAQKLLADGHKDDAEFVQEIIAQLRAYGPLKKGISQTREFTVKANSAWVPTGLTLPVGTAVTVRVGGKWAPAQGTVLGTSIRYSGSGHKPFGNANLYPVALKIGDKIITCKVKGKFTVKKAEEILAQMTPAQFRAELAMLGAGEVTVRLKYKADLDPSDGKEPLDGVIRGLRENTRSVPGNNGQWTEDYAIAQKLSRQSGKPLLVLFTAPSWCAYCRKLNDEVLSSPEFTEMAKSQAILFKADYSDPRSQPEKLRQQNMELKNQFGGRGLPEICVLDPEGRLTGKIGGYSPRDIYLNRLRTALLNKTPLAGAARAANNDQAEGNTGEWKDRTNVNDDDDD